MVAYKEQLQENNAKIEAIQTALKNKIASSEQKLEKEFNIAYAKQMDIMREIIDGNPLVERDYTESEMQKLEATLVSLTKGE